MLKVMKGMIVMRSQIRNKVVQEMFIFIFSADFNLIFKDVCH